VRDALGRLQADGLVVSRQGAGTFVKRRPPPELFRVAEPSDVSEYLRGMEARLAIETDAARLAAQRRSHAELQRIRASLEALRATIDERRPGANEDFDFHVAVAEASGNDLFVKFLTSIRNQVLGQMSMSLGLTQLGSDTRRAQVMLEHELIVQAIEDGDADAAAMFMRAHLYRARMRSTAAQSAS
jgi:DNA-binding FadR family transcriptional regulator